MKHYSHVKRRYSNQNSAAIFPCSVKSNLSSVVSEQRENEFQVVKGTGPGASLRGVEPEPDEPLSVPALTETGLYARSIIISLSTKGPEVASSFGGKKKVMQSAKCSYLGTLLCILLLLAEGDFSVLRAQEFDPALVGASFVLPLQLVDWPLKIGPEAQLFVDDFLIHSMSKVVRIDHQPKKYEGNPIMEGRGNTIIYDPKAKQYRMYYGHRVAFSKDGLNWTIPNLGIVLSNGSTDNNLVMDDSFPGELSFIYDPRDPDPSRRWKAAAWYYTRPARKGEHGLFGLVSPDGLHWKKDALLFPGIVWENSVQLIPGVTVTWEKDALFIPSKTDVATNWPLTGVDDVSRVVWDERMGKFIAWLKIWEMTDGRMYRARAMAVSDDFIHWSQPWSVLLADKLDAPGDQFYGMTGWSYESMWIGTIRVFHSARHTYSAKPVDFQLVTSRDGIHWARAANRGPFIPNGPEGSYDHGYHTDFSNPPLRIGDELFFYYASSAYGVVGAPTDMKPGICLAKLRVDGFASLHAMIRNEPGYVITRPLDFTGKELYVNANAEKGSIQVEILSGDMDNDLKPILGFTARESVPLEGDSIEQRVTWKGHQDLSSLTGKRIRLKFYLNGLAALYSFTIH